MKNNEITKSNSDSQKIQYKNVHEIPEALSIEELAIFLRISKSAAYNLIKHENIKTQKCFSKKFISKNIILDFITHKRKEHYWNYRYMPTKGDLLRKEIELNAS